MGGDLYRRLELQGLSRLSRRRALQGAAAGGVGLALAACSSNNNKGSKTATTGAATQAATAAGAAPTSAGSPAAGGPAATRAATGAAPAASPAAQQPKRGGKINLVNAGEAPNEDVHKSNTAYLAGFGLGAAYSGLVKPKSTGHNGTNIPEGDLAEKWEQPDHTSYIFHIRNAKFQNIAPLNGRLVTADDAVYSFKRQIAEKANAGYLEGVTNMQATDKQTLRLDLADPNVDFITTISDPRVKVLGHEAVELHGDLVNGPTIGTGPWILKQFQRGVSQNLVRNPDYYNSALPYADELNFLLITDGAAAEAQLANGALTYAMANGFPLPVSAVPRLTSKGLPARIDPPSAQMWIIVNTARPQYKDPRVRKALSIAINRKLIIDNVFNGQGQSDTSGVALPAPDWRLPKDEIDKLLPFDPKAAKAMLDAAGAKLQADEVQSLDGSSAAAAQLVQANWKDIGFDSMIKVITTIEQNSSVYVASVAKFSTCVTLIGHASSLTGDLETWYKTNGSKNGGSISDPQLDQLIVQQKQEFDEQKRRAIVFDIQRKIIDLGANIPLIAAGVQYVYQKTAHNVEPPPVNGACSHFAEIWLEA